MIFIILICCLILTFLTILLLYGRESVAGIYFQDVVVGIFCLISVFSLVMIFAAFVLRFEDTE